jgi:cytochrome P450
MHLGFGWGIHACMGSHLARAEAIALFTEIVRRGLTITLDGPPVRVASNSFTGLKRLPATVVRHGRAGTRHERPRGSVMTPPPRKGY